RARRSWSSLCSPLGSGASRRGLGAQAGGRRIGIGTGPQGVKSGARSGPSGQCPGRFQSIPTNGRHVSSTILVTGAAGYVGGALTRRLLAEPETSVIGVDSAAMDHGAEGVREIIGHPRFTMVREDVRNTAALEPLLERADAVVHLA